MKSSSPKRFSSRYAGMLCMGLICALGLMGMLKVCSSSHPFGASEFSRSGGDTIEIAIQYSPLMLYTYDDTLGGFSYDMLREIGKREGLKMKFHPVVSLAEAVQRLKEGDFDVVVADMPRTISVIDETSFTVPVYLDRMVLVQSSTDSALITSQLDLANKEVWVAAGSPAMMRLRNLSDEIGDTIIVRCDPQYGPEQLLMMVATGDIGLAVVNRGTADVLAPEYDDINILTAISFTQFQSWLTNSSDTLLTSRLDSCINRFTSTREYSDLLKRYGVDGVSGTGF